MTASCGGSSTASDGAAGNAPSSIYAIFSARVTLKGEMSLHGTFTDNLTARHETCKQYADGLVPATTLFVVPTPNDTSNVNGHSVMYTAGVLRNTTATGYHGPATYAGVSTTVSVLIVDNASYLPGNNPTTTITVAPDGSGSMSFAGLVDVFTNAAESGTVAWSCAD